MSDGPAKFLVIPDPHLVGQGATVSATQQAGSYVGRCVALSTNEGFGSAFLTGHYQNADELSYRLTCVGAGGVYHSATWAWSYSTDVPNFANYQPTQQATDNTVNNYEMSGFPKGENDYRYIHHCGALHASPVNYRQIRGVYLPTTMEEIWYYRDRDTPYNLSIRRRNAHKELGWKGWDADTFALDATHSKEVGFDVKLGSVTKTDLADYFNGFDACVLDDKKTIMLAWPEGRDWDIYQSTDGTNFELVSKSIVGRFTKTEVNRRYSVCLEASGPYIRLVWVDNIDAASSIRTMISSDNGASWAEVSKEEIYPHDLGGSFPFGVALSPAKDDAGTFMLTVNEGGYGCVVYGSAGNGEWAQCPDASGYYFGGLVDGKISSYSGQMGGGFFRGWMVVVAYQLSGSDLGSTDYPMVNFGFINAEHPSHPGTLNASRDFNIWLVDPANFRDTDGWKCLRTGIERYQCPWGSGSISVVDLEDALAVVNMFHWKDDGHETTIDGANPSEGAQGSDNERKSFANYATDHAQYFRVGSWDQQPIHEKFWTTYRRGFRSVNKATEANYYSYKHQPKYMPHRAYWRAAHGIPAPYSDPRSSVFGQWIESSTAAPSGTGFPTIDWNGMRMRITDPSMSPNGAKLRYRMMMDDLSEWSSMGIDQGALYVRGCMIEWCMKLESDPDERYTDVAVQLFIQNFINYSVPSSAASGGGTTVGTGGAWIPLRVNIGKTAAAIYCIDATTPIGTAGSQAVLGLPTGETFKDEYYIFRLAIADMGRQDTMTTHGGGTAKVFLKCRRVDQEEWHMISTPISLHDYIQGGAGFKSAYVEFGHSNQSGVQQKSLWRWFYIMGFSEYTQMIDRLSADYAWEWWKDYPPNLRGSLMSSVPRRIGYHKDNVNAWWSGAGAKLGDKWTVDPDYNYAAGNVFLPSPRSQWRSRQAGVTQDLVFKSQAGSSEAKFMHSGVCVVGTNVKEYSIQYADDTAFSSPITWSIDTQVGSTWKLDTPRDSSTFELHGGGLTGIKLPLAGEYAQGTDMNPLTTNGRYFIRVTTGTYAGKTWEITGHPDPDHIVIDDSMTDLTAGSVAGQSAVIFSDRAVFVENALASGSLYKNPKKYMRIRIPSTETVEPMDNDYRIGQVIAGLTFPFTVPMDWAYTDNQQPNVTTYRTKSAVSWAFVEGPPQRSINGMVVGDVTQQWRQSFRNQIRQYAEFQRRPVAFVLDDTRLTHFDTVLTGYVTTGSDMQNAGWFKDDVGVWRSAGDLTIDFTEDV